MLKIPENKKQDNLLNPTSMTVDPKASLVNSVYRSNESSSTGAVQDVDPGGEGGSVRSTCLRAREAAVAGDISKVNPLTQGVVQADGISNL